MKKERYLSKYLGIVGFSFILFVAFCGLYYENVSFSAMSAKPKKSETAAPGDCSACHSNEKILPADHVNTKKMTSTECAECHKNDSKSLRVKIPLSHTHQLSGVDCDDCHETAKPAKPLKTAECLFCHGSYNEVVEGTAKLDPNPHNSPHYGKELDCDLCHHQHSKSENFCAQCHEWELIVP